MKMRINPVPSPWFARYRDLPTIQILTNRMDDDDVEAHGDLIYWRSLLHDVLERIYCDHYRPTPWPTALSDHLNALELAVEDLSRRRDHPGELLARWKQDGPGVRQHPEP